jgi:hypothetical protein
MMSCCTNSVRARSGAQFGLELAESLGEDPPERGDRGVLDHAISLLRT